MQNQNVMKILLINPSFENIINSEVPRLIKQEVGIFPPLGIMYVASYFTKNSYHQVRILDMLAKKLNYQQMQEYIQNYKPDILGITGHTHNLIDIVKIARISKAYNSNIHVTVGGSHVNAFPYETIQIPQVDSVVVGEGEITFFELVEALSARKPLKNVKGVIFKEDGKTVSTGVRDEIENLDSIPFPIRDSLDVKRYYYILGKKSYFSTIISSRGCPHRCIFCSTPKGKFRMRLAENIVDEMAECQNKGIKEIHFVDDVFNADLSRIIKISNEILKRDISIYWSFRGRADNLSHEMLNLAKKAGCVRVHLGVETSTDEGLELLNKNLKIEKVEEAFNICKKARISTVAYFMIGCPHDKTKEDVFKTINFAKKLNPDFAMFNILTPYPRTRLYEEGLKRGILKKDYWTGFAQNPTLDFTPEIWEEWLSKKELEVLLNVAWKRFYLQPKVIIRSIYSFVSFNILVRKLKTLFKIRMLKN
jgi:radical SAM superfamily enzyme YgiQ (UPF0313 family)